jgi:hypothetical protein
MLKKVLYINPRNDTTPLRVRASSPITAQTNNGPPLHYAVSHTHISMPEDLQNTVDLNRLYQRCANTYTPHDYITPNLFTISPNEQIIITFNDKNTCLKTIKKNTIINNPKKKAHLAFIIKNRSNTYFVEVPVGSTLMDLLRLPNILHTPAWIQQFDENKENETICSHCSKVNRREENTPE